MKLWTTPITCANLTILNCPVRTVIHSETVQTKINPEALATVKNVTQVQNQHWVVTVVAVAWVILENLAATPVPVTCYLAKTLAL